MAGAEVLEVPELKYPSGLLVKPLDAAG